MDDVLQVVGLQKVGRFLKVVGELGRTVAEPQANSASARVLDASNVSLERLLSPRTLKQDTRGPRRRSTIAESRFRLSQKAIDSIHVCDRGCSLRTRDSGRDSSRCATGRTKKA